MKLNKILLFKKVNRRNKNLKIKKFKIIYFNIKIRLLYHNIIILMKK